ncbi:TlpA family protein disulfide reductase [Vibrio renipiscarius]|uniref:Cytochrome oxidase assembly protein n=1 Tax=Vibrio renipiscarius TaxID=1461322 RepID=A0A0C2NPS1_9VIBR|nr:TlpA disulfide reductase family protein [Vibrio renipiscarius]KII76097.1 cytochrome oxidase assembly protein [Vibrio renipiscarius]KII79202.1 cytochrome oxidase assembly protein [Vibrio renipiscarius]
MNNTMHGVTLRVFVLVVCVFNSAFVSAQQCVTPDGFTSVSAEGQVIQTFDALPDLIQTTSHGAEQTNKPVTLVNLWAVWCPPCLKELPMLDSIANQADFAIETIHLGNNADALQKRFDELNIQHLPKNIEPDYALLDRWGFRGLPATLIVVNNQVHYRSAGYLHQSADELAHWLSCLSQSSASLSNTNEGAQ